MSFWNPADVGFAVRSKLADLGQGARLFARLAGPGARSLGRFSLVRDQIHFLGNYSLAIIAISGLFVGFVLGLQGYYTLQRYGSADALGLLVALSLVRELGPVVAALLFAVKNARAMNVMALHAEAAATLGIRVGALRKGLFFVSGLLTASAVTTAGSIGFVGLIVPHACRFAVGPDHRLLIPAATLAGGTYLMLADTLARTIIAPEQLPVGVITALVGAPVFLYQLHRLRK